MSKAVGILVEKRIVCGFCAPTASFHDGLLVKCTISNSNIIQGKELEDYSIGCTKLIFLRLVDVLVSFAKKKMRIGLISVMTRLQA